MQCWFRGALRSAVIVCFLVGNHAFSQVTTADIVGTVVDTTGAVVPGAQVTIENLGTRETRTAKSSGSGDFVFNLLQPGQYSLRVEASGFKGFQVPTLSLAAGDRVRADAHMQLGEQSQTVEVTAAPPAMQTDSSTLTSVVTEHAVQDLPLNGRNFITLVQTTAGANPGPPNSIQTGTRPDERRQTSSISANGQPEALNDNMIDGMDNNEREQGLLMVRPSIDAIAEVKVDTNTYTAEVGRSAGAVVNVITKSGSNAFHGSLYEFLRNDALDANDFFSNSAGLPNPKYRQNQFGGSIGGPIRKNKTFFFGDIEELRIVQGSPTGLLTVPTLFEQKNPGNFSDVGGPVVPASRLNPVALNYFALYPQPNVPGAGALNNYSGNPVRTQNATTADVRVDHRFSDSDNMFARYSYNPVATFTPGQLPPVNGIQPGGGSYPGPNNETAQGIQLHYVHIFSPSLIAEFKAGYSRLNIQSLALNAGTKAAEKFGMPNVDIDDFNSGLAPVVISGYEGLGDSNSLPIIDINNVFQYDGAVTYTRGAHNIKMGAGLIRRQLNYFQANAGEGQFTFSGSSPLSMADFLGGTATTITRQNPLYRFYLRSWEPDIYIQDDWRATRWLTLNLGLRWDYFSPLTETRNHRANFDLESLQMVVASPSNPSAGVQSDYGNFAPRIGFAASPGHGMVIRGGFGLSYYGYEGVGATNLTNPPNYYVFTCQPAATSAALMCPAGIGSLSGGPPLPTFGSINPLSGGLYAKAMNYHTSYIEQFNLTVQKQFGQNVVSAAYVGELGRHQQTTTNADLPLPSTGAQPLPFVYAAQLPGVNGISFRASLGTSSYNAAQFSFERRYSKGLILNANYTYARSLNDFADGISSVGQVANNMRYDWGNSDIDVRHRLAVTANYELPFGKSAAGVKKWLFGGWQINSVAFWQTGLPFTVMDGAFKSAPINLPGVSSDRPNTVSGQSLAVSDPSITEWFNIGAFTPQPHGTAGNEGRNQLYAPSTRQLDVSLFKDFTIREAWHLQFRAECYNLTNTENFGSPNATIRDFGPSLTPTTAGSFGQVTSTLLGANPRQIQFALKLLF